LGQKPWEDRGPSYGDWAHSTCTAGKAVGQNYGASKKAKLIVVQLNDIDSTDFIDALELIAQDVKSKPERRKKSVVTMSWGLPRLEPTQLQVLDMQIAINDLFEVDVPLFAASGNDAPTKGRIDAYPGLFASPEFPLITVGSADFDGKRSSFSQAGPQLTTYAVGNDITCVSTSGSNPIPELWGTSYAASLVAGNVANLLSYDTVPFDTSDGNLVKSLRDYLPSNQGSWERPGGVKMIWSVPNS